MTDEPIVPALPDARTPLHTDGVEVVRSEERLRAGVERRVSGRVRIAKRVVTEERTLTVTVRREELVVEHLPASETAQTPGVGPDVTSPARSPGHHGSDAVLTLVLSEEVPEVSVRTVPRERVRVHVDRVTAEETVTGDVALERVDVDVDDTRRGR